VLQCVAVCCSVLQCVAIEVSQGAQFARLTCCMMSIWIQHISHIDCNRIAVIVSSCCSVLRLKCAVSVLQCVTIEVCCGLQCVTIEVLRETYGLQQRDSICVLQCVAKCRCVLQCLAVSRSVLQYVAVCCSVLQCVAVCYD